jgi:hypothetical protein
MNKKHFYGVCGADSWSKTDEFLAAKRRGLLAGIAVLFLAAVFAGCDDGGGGGGGGNGGNENTNTGLTIYKRDGSVYTGTGTVQTVTATSYGFGDEETSLDAIGSISADGKLSITIPATIPDTKLFAVPQSYGDGTVKGAILGIITSSNLTLAPMYSDVSVVPMYFNKAFTASVNGENVEMKKGYNYFVSDTETIPSISSCNWGISDY